MPVHPLEERKLPPTSGTKFGAGRSASGRPPECGGGHCGVDLYYWRGGMKDRDYGSGRPVFAVADGKVIAAGTGDRAGVFVWLNHGGWRSHYVHLGSRNVDLHEQVKQGQPIGTLGRTGIKRDPAHLHFALSRGGKYYNPVPSLQSWDLVDGSSKTGIFGLVAASLALLYWLKTRG